MRASVTGLVVSIPRDPAPGLASVRSRRVGRCLIGSDEDRSANLRTRSRGERCSRICGLTGSIVPATGPPDGAGVAPARTLLPPVDPTRLQPPLGPPPLGW